MLLVRQHFQCALEPQPLDELTERLTEDRTEHAVEVKRREAGGTCDLFELERLVEILEDVVDRAVDARNVVERGVPEDLGIGSQDLSSSARSGLL